MRYFVFALLFTAVRAEADESPRLVCMGRTDRPIALKVPDCVIVAAPFLGIDPTETSRPVIVVDPDRGTMLMVVKPSAGKVDLHAPGLARVSASVVSSWAPAFTVTVRSPEGDVWRWVEPSTETGIVSFLAPPGRYRFSVEAPDHKRLVHGWVNAERP